MEFADLDAHLHAQRRVEVGERFVEQEGRRLAHDGAADRDALALTARELTGLAFEIVGEVEDPRGLLHFLLDDVGALSGHLEREGDVVAHAHMRIERIGLEHHRQPPLRRADLRHVLAVDEHLARGHILQSRDETQKRGLAAARGTDEDGELAVLDVEIDAVDDIDGAEGLSDLLQLNAAHGGFSLWPYFTAPNVRPRTSCFCENQPRTRIGAIASVEAAESFAQKKPSGAE